MDGIASCLKARSPRSLLRLPFGISAEFGNRHLGIVTESRQPAQETTLRMESLNMSCLLRHWALKRGSLISPGGGLRRFRLPRLTIHSTVAILSGSRASNYLTCVRYRFGRIRTRCRASLRIAKSGEIFGVVGESFLKRWSPGGTVTPLENGQTTIRLSSKRPGWTKGPGSITWGGRTALS